MSRKYPVRISDAEAALIMGGKSVRMGEDKATKLLGGVPLYSYGHQLTRGLFARVRLVGTPQTEPTSPLHPLPPVEQDLNPGMGPLAGVETALAGAEEPWVFVLACDHPFVSPGLVKALAGMREADVDVVCPRKDQTAYPTVAFYRRGVVRAVRSALAAGDLALRDTVRRSRVRWLAGEKLEIADPQGRSLWNLNTTEDWRQAEAIVRRGRPEIETGFKTSS